MVMQESYNVFYLKTDNSVVFPKEMLSPSANGPTRADDNKDTVMSTTPPCSTQEPPQKETRRKEKPRTATAEVKDLLSQLNFQE